MARPAVGTVIREPTQRGISYALRVTFQRERYRVPLGGSWEGWDEDRVQREREYIALQIERGEWVPPRRKPSQPVTVAGGIPTFQVFASEYAQRKRRRVSDKTHKDLVWRLQIGMDHFGSYLVNEITEAVIDDFTNAMLAEREHIRAAREAGTPIMETITMPNGRTYQRRRRPLSNDSINKAIAAVRQVLKDAMRRYPQQVVHNPASDRDVYLKVPPVKRSFLEAHHIAALLDGARQLDGRKGAMDWDKVQYIRGSDKSNTALARQLGVSDVLVSKIRRGLVWSDKPAGQRPQRLAVVVTRSSLARASASCAASPRTASISPPGGSSSRRATTSTTARRRRPAPASAPSQPCPRCARSSSTRAPRWGRARTRSRARRS